LTIQKIDISSAIASVKKILKSDKSLSAEARAMFELMLVIVELLINKLGINSSNSSKPPSQDRNREKKSKKGTGRKPGGQLGREGKNLVPSKSPDVVKKIEVDRDSLPIGSYTEVGFAARQVFDINISCVVTEYRAQILQDQNGKKFTAPFPEGVTRPAQYGTKIKGQAVYMSQYQMLPYDRLREYFSDQCGVPLSAGSLSNFIDTAYDLLEGFEKIAKSNLAKSQVAHADETGINVNGKLLWLHSLSSPTWSLFFPHAKRGRVAMEAMGVLKQFNGILVHDHWKPYFSYECIHALCNAHHLRELERAWEQDGQKWAVKMKKLLLKIKDSVEKSGGSLSKNLQSKFIKSYRSILAMGKRECPAGQKKDGVRGRVRNSKSRNLLDRLQEFENETLRFMVHKSVPFTNNSGENDIRMTKVQQKISGCFRSIDGAYRFCRIRSYILTCQKNGIEPSDAIDRLFSGNLPGFITDTA